MCVHVCVLLVANRIACSSRREGGTEGGVGECEKGPQQHYDKSQQDDVIQLPDAAIT